MLKLIMSGLQIALEIFVVWRFIQILRHPVRSRVDDKMTLDEYWDSAPTRKDVRSLLVRQPCTCKSCRDARRSS